MEDEKERQKQAEIKSFNGGNMAFSTQGFRDLDEKFLKSLTLDSEFQNIDKNFPNRKRVCHPAILFLIIKIKCGLINC